jgi:hypothetical protein
MRAREGVKKEEFAEVVYGIVRKNDPSPILARIEQPPAREGSTASTVAAHIARLPSWGSGTAANYAAYRRARPGEPPLPSTAEELRRAFDETVNLMAPDTRRESEISET